jgi:hypothetical protein
MNYYYVTFSNGWGRRNIYAKDATDAQRKAGEEMPLEWMEEVARFSCLRDWESSEFARMLSDEDNDKLAWFIIDVGW